MSHEIARNWRLKKERYNLVGERCNDGHYVFPPRDICPHCGGEAREPYRFSGKGEVFSFTKIFEAPTGFDENSPYTVALIKLEEGPMITAQLTDLDPHQEVEIGMRVEMVTRKIKSEGDQGLITYGYKFRPII